ncbi:MAG: FlhC family transcriptional regulator [Nevskiaceae bacterium]|nr:FlhC family transcriptional regulator [Nevskiaceae bacterium]
MRISDDRYNRDRIRFDLALRFIRHEARTHTIRIWTGLTDDRIRKLYRSYFPANGGVARRRGKSPQLASFFLRTPRMRHETAVLASMCYLYGVMPQERVADAPRRMPCAQRGEALCGAYETYRRLVPTSRISLEHAIYLVTSLARGDELRPSHCADCWGLIVVDRFAVSGRRCRNCENWRHGKLLRR